MSKRQKKSEEVRKHRHCVLCGAAMRGPGKFCSKKCEEEYEKRLKKRKYMTFIPPIIMVVILIVMFVATLGYL